VTDYIGHCFGPFSLEYEDNLLQLDRHLADFFAYLDQRIGMQNILIVFASDHGIDAIPEYRLSLAPSAAQGQTGTYPDTNEYEGLGGRHYPDRFIARLNETLKKQLATDQNLIAAFWNPNLYLDTQAVKRAGLDEKVVSKALAEEVMSLSGFAVAISYEDMTTGRIPQNDVAHKMSNSFSPLRSGDVMIVQKPFWYLYPDPDTYAAMHGSPYTYDTHVPVIFAGSNMKAMRLSRPIEPTDIAATIAEYLGHCPPSHCIGEPLAEVLECKRRHER
jgi:arylsulfatase A-like enzyme